MEEEQTAQPDLIILSPWNRKYSEERSPQRICHSAGCDNVGLGVQGAVSKG